MFTEIYKLISLLVAAHLPFSCVPCYDGLQVHLYSDRQYTQELDDCICHSQSAGFKLGLLETRNLSCYEGFETAEQVFEGWKQMYTQAQEPEVKPAHKSLPIYLLVN